MQALKCNPNGRAHTAAAAPSAKGDEGAGGRDTAGRFVKGRWKGGPGNPFNRQIAQLRKALVGAVTEDDMKRLANSLLDQATAGNMDAARLLLSYLLGQPPEQTVHPDEVDIDEDRI